VRAIIGSEIVLRWRIVMVSLTPGSVAPVSCSTVPLDVPNDRLALVLAAVDEQPAGAFGNVAAYQHDADTQHRTERERPAPAELGGHQVGVEQRHRED